MKSILQHVLLENMVCSVNMIAQRTVKVPVEDTRSSVIPARLVTMETIATKHVRIANPELVSKKRGSVWGSVFMVITIQIAQDGVWTRVV